MENQFNENAFLLEGAKGLKMLDNDGRLTKTTEVKMRHLNSGKRIKAKVWRADLWPYAKFQGYVLVLSRPLTIKQYNDKVYHSFSLNQPFKVFEDTKQARCEDPTSDEEYVL